MRVITIFCLVIAMAMPVWAAISCPSGMMLASTVGSPIPDCVCPSGQRPRMSITADGNATTRFGSCPQVRTFLPNPSYSGNVTSTHYGAWQVFRVPETTVYSIDAWGAQGGQSGAAALGGKGAWAHGEFTLTAGTEVNILVGQQGENDPFTQSAGGGGGSFIVYNAKPLLVAGGGGGGSNISGQPGKDALNPGSGTTVAAKSVGGSWKDTASTNPSAPRPVSAGNGLCNGGFAITSCGSGGVREDCSTSGGDGGFGGAGAGACSSNLAGSGGGYTGGNGTNPASGGTSYIDSTATSPASAANMQSGGGKVVISW